MACEGGDELLVMCNELNTSRSNAGIIKNWIYNVKEMIKGRKIPKNNIRRYFEC